MNAERISRLLKAVARGDFPGYQKILAQVPRCVACEEISKPIAYDHFDSLHLLPSVFLHRFNFYKEKEPKGICLLGYMVMWRWFLGGLGGNEKKFTATEKMLEHSLETLMQFFSGVPKEVFYLCSICPPDGVFLMLLILTNREINRRRQHPYVSSRPAYAGGLEDPAIGGMFMEILRGYHDGRELFENDPKEWKTQRCVCDMERHDSHDYALLFAVINGTSFPLNLRLCRFFLEHSEEYGAEAKSRIEADLSIATSAFSYAAVRAPYLPYTEGLRKRKNDSRGWCKFATLNRLLISQQFEATRQRTEGLASQNSGKRSAMQEYRDERNQEILASVKEKRQVLPRQTGSKARSTRRRDSVEVQKYISGFYRYTTQSSCLLNGIAALGVDDSDDSDDGGDFSDSDSLSDEFPDDDQYDAECGDDEDGAEHVEDIDESRRLRRSGLLYIEF